MKKVISAGSTLLILMVFLTMNTRAQQISKPRSGATGSWRLLGSVEAKFTADHDVIIVAGPYDYFRKLKFKVTDAPLKMQRMVVTYDGGGLPEKIETRFDIPEGGESRVVDLKGGKRKIRTIEFWYDTKGILKGRANVTVFGMK